MSTEMPDLLSLDEWRPHLHRPRFRSAHFVDALIAELAAHRATLRARGFNRARSYPESQCEHWYKENCDVTLQVSSGPDGVRWSISAQRRAHDYPDLGNLAAVLDAMGAYQAMTRNELDALERKVVSRLEEVWSAGTVIGVVIDVFRAERRKLKAGQT